MFALILFASIFFLVVWLSVEIDWIVRKKAIFVTGISDRNDKSLRRFGQYLSIAFVLPFIFAKERGTMQSDH